MRNWTPRIAGLALAAISIGGCATASSSTACPPPVEYTRAQQIQVADEIAAHLPDGSMIEVFLADYAVTRDQLRACRR